jgi:hypothetical protein
LIYTHKLNIAVTEQIRVVNERLEPQQELAFD